MSARQRLIDVECDLIKPYETEAGYHVSNGSVETWLPKSQVEWHPEEDKTHTGTMVMPEWLAIDKGLI